MEKDITGIMVYYYEVCKRKLWYYYHNINMEQNNENVAIGKFIDASKKFIKGKKQNEMSDEHIDEVMDLYNRRETVDKESYLASFDDIEKNDFNLNIPRYVDNFEKEEEVDINGLLEDMQKTDDEIGKVEGEFVNLLKDLSSSDDNIMASLKRYIDMIEG